LRTVGAIPEPRIRVARPALPALERFAGVLADVWDRAMLSNDGPCARDFERAFADYSGGRGHVLAASNCDVALTLLLAALELPRGSRALVASFGFPSTMHALEWNGLRPHFVDVDAHDWCLHAEQLDGQLDGVSVIVATHMFGVPCDVAALEDIAAERGIKLVLDAAQAVGTWVGERHVTDFGDASAISFGGTKIVTAAEGAIVVLRDERCAERFRQLRNYGMNRQGISEQLGLNAKISELHAALGVLTLEELEAEIDLRGQLVDAYRRELSFREDVALQRVPPGSRSTPTFFVADVGGARDRVRAALAERGIESRPYFPPLHRMPRFASVSRASLPVTERLGESLLALPLYSGLDPAVVVEVCEVIGMTLAPVAPDGM
jgi:dTDP-4-amino-4,6-dideoxygalactose transaminase